MTHGHLSEPWWAWKQAFGGSRGGFELGLAGELRTWGVVELVSLPSLCVSVCSHKLNISLLRCAFCFQSEPI